MSVVLNFLLAGSSKQWGRVNADVSSKIPLALFCLHSLYHTYHNGIKALFSVKDDNYTDGFSKPIEACHGLAQLPLSC